MIVSGGGKKKIIELTLLQLPHGKVKQNAAGVRQRIDSVSRRPRERNEVINEAGVVRIKISRGCWNFQGWRTGSLLAAVALVEAGSRGWKLDQRCRGWRGEMEKDGVGKEDEWAGEVEEEGCGRWARARRRCGCPLPRFLSSRYTTENVEGKGRGLISNDPGFLGGE